MSELYITENGGTAHVVRIVRRRGYANAVSVDAKQLHIMSRKYCMIVKQIGPTTFDVETKEVNLTYTGLNLGIVSHDDCAEAFSKRVWNALKRTVRRG